MPTSFAIRSAFEIPIQKQAEAFSRAFSDYVAGPTRLDPEGLARYFFTQAVDLWFSRVVLQNQEMIGFGYINRTGAISRLAGMGIIPEARHRGIGRQLLDALLQESRRRQDRLFTLEVFEQNPPAVALYRRSGFREVGRLVEWRISSAAFPAGPHTDELTLLEIHRRASCFEYPAIPWQISRHAAVKLPPFSRAFGLGTSSVVITPTETDLCLRMLHQAPQALEPNWAELRQLVASVLNQFPGRSCLMPAILPEQIGQQALAPLGFARQALNQFQMELAL